jgi:Family of unknown function (DUF6292)
MLDLLFDDTMARGLRGYVRQVVEALELTGEGSFVQTERPACAYLALEGRLPGFPDRDVALLWDETQGWSAALETQSGEALAKVASFEKDVLPHPSDVAHWVKRLFQDETSGETRAGPRAEVSPDDVRRRLAEYAIPTFVSMP